MACLAVASFLARREDRIKIEYYAGGALSAGDRQAGLIIAEGFERTARMDALQTSHLTPFDLPGTPGFSDLSHYIFQNRDIGIGIIVGDRSGLGLRAPISPICKNCHRFRIECAHAIP